ncbi:RHS repeat domain-containing protein [Tenacibaculum jejuense]|uniref:YD repeat-containing protein n=1 Tax=Tenacibaculum jejuense TaxID=584609 RepID=A0A238UD30_9FLAO|nr:RHS repeat domain-containing protein [Tenacibaculum jejuense]SNR17107.1 exported protein of unknown function [Tenacibaculum jejuense]
MRKLSFSIFMLLSFVFCYGQGSAPELPTIIQPSPEARKMIEYGNIPVNYNTGIPSVEVPIHSLAVEGSSFPIALSYHGGAVRVGDVDGMLGLKWTLTNGGGRISRSVRGRPDEDNLYNNSGWLKSGVNVDNLDITQLSLDEKTQIKDGCWDLQPDIFNIMLPNGRSLEFMFKKTGEILMIPLSKDIKVEYTANLASWTVTDNQGTRYYFATPETTKSSSSCSAWQPICNPVGYNFPTSWMLDKVIFPNGNEVTYTYANENYIEKSWSNFKLRKNQSLLGGINNPATWNNAINTICGTSTHYARKRLTRVTYKKTRIDYSYSLKNSSKPSDGSKLDQIYITYNGQHVKKVRLSYYINAQERMFLEHVKEVSKTNEELLISSFEYHQKEYFPHRNSVAIDHFGYYNGSTSAGAYSSQRLAPDDDFYFSGGMGTYGVNRKLNASRITYGSLVKQIYPTKGYTVFEYEPNEVYRSVSPASREVKINSIPSDITGWKDYYSDYFTLPTTKTFTFSSINISNFDNLSTYANWTKPILQLISSDGQVHYTKSNFKLGENVSSPIQINNLPNKEFRVKLRIYNTPTVSLGVFVKGHYRPGPQEQNIYFGGLRIKSVTNYDSNGVKARKKIYDYSEFNKPNVSSGDSSASLSSYYNLVKEPVIEVNSIGVSFVARYNHFDEITSVNPVQVDYVNNTPVYYRNVKETFENANNSYHIKRTYKNYGVNFKSSLITLEGFGYSIPLQTPSTFEGYANGVLQIVETLDTKGKVVSKTVYEKAFKNSDGIDTQVIQCVKYSLNTDTHCVKQEYPTISRWFVDTKTTETRYDTNGATTTVTQLAYDNPSHKQLTRQLVTNSKGETIISTTKYAHDVNDSRLITENRVAEPLEVETKKVIGGTTVVLSKQKTIYDDDHNISGIYLPKNIRASKGTQALEDRVVYHSYDTKGNPTEVSKKDGTHIVYIWGYRQTQPIAKIEGVDLSALSETTMANLQDLSDSDDDRTLGYQGKEGDLREALDALRSLPELSKAQITTYTYDPLIGITSITDPRGYVMYYEYDNFNRLKLIKDASGNLIQETKYNYKN